MSFLLRFGAIAGLCVVSVAAGCAPPEETVPESSEADVVARVLGDNAKVKEDRIVFPKSVFPDSLRKKIDRWQEAKKDGKAQEETEAVILVSDRQKNASDAEGKLKTDVGNPYGYIRRALSYKDDGDSTTVMTEQASIEEAFQELDANGTLDIGSDTGKAGQVKPKVSGSFSKKLPVIDLAGKTIYQKNGILVRVKRGSVTLDLDVDIGVSVSWFRIKEAHVQVGADIASEVELEAVLGGVDLEFEKELFQGRWPVGSIGPIPVTAGLTTSVECEIKGQTHATATAGARVEFKGMKAGVAYEKGKGLDGTWKGPSFNPSLITPTFEFDPTTAEGTAKCAIKPKVDIMLFDALGPNVTPALTSRLDVATPPPSLTVYGGIDVRVGGTFKVFGKTLGNIDKSVYSFEKQLWTNKE